MIPTGSELRWRDGCIVLPALKWKSPSKRRVPHLLVEHRAKEEGVLIFIKDSYLLFKESGTPVSEIKLTGGQKEAQLYQKRYHLIPAEIEGEDSFIWLSKSDNAVLFFGKNGKYFVKPAKRPL